MFTLLPQVKGHMSSDRTSPEQTADLGTVCRLLDDEKAQCDTDLSSSVNTRNSHTFRAGLQVIITFMISNTTAAVYDEIRANKQQVRVLDLQDVT